MKKGIIKAIAILDEMNREAVARMNAETDGEKALMWAARANAFTFAAMRLEREIGKR